MTREDTIRRIWGARFLEQAKKAGDMYCKQQICSGYCASKRCENCVIERVLNKKKEQFMK